jgi:hypothetical protein
MKLCRRLRIVTISTGAGTGFAILPGLRGRWPAQIVVVTALDDIPARPPTATSTG